MPWELLVEGASVDNPFLITPKVEIEHVKDLYNAIAPHWHGTALTLTSFWTIFTPFFQLHTPPHTHTHTGRATCSSACTCGSCADWRAYPDGLPDPD